MKKKLMMMLFLLTGVGISAMAGNVITTNEVIIRPGGTTELIVNLENDADFQVYAYDFRLYLPVGVEVVKDGTYIYALGPRNANHAVNVQKTSDGAIQFGVSSPELYLTGTTGTVLGIKLQADASLVEETTLQGSIKKITYANKQANTVHPEDMTFDIKIKDRVVLDENALMVPDGTSSEVNILVKRNIKANEWSTICLPFAMPVDKLTAAFGNDYQLAYISGSETVTEGGKIIGINVQFTPRTQAAIANSPYIIKVSKDISEFEVKAKIIPTDGKKTEVKEVDDETGEEISICSMTGNLKAGTIVPENSLFLNENKFWYSVGLTKMKAFRAYFTLKDVLTDVSHSGARVSFSVGDETTGIERLENSRVEELKSFYNLAGQRVEKPTKGIYIVNGKKWVVK